MILNDFDILKKMYEEDKNKFIKYLIEIFKPDCDLQIDLANKIIMSIKNKNDKLESEFSQEMTKNGFHLNRLAYFLTQHAFQYDEIMDQKEETSEEKEYIDKFLELANKKD